MAMTLASTFAVVMNYTVINIGLIVLLIPILQRLTTSFGSERELQALRSFIYFLIVYIVTDTIAVFQIREVIHLSPNLYRLVMIINEICLPIISYSWMVYGIRHLDYSHLDNYKTKIILLAPAIITILMSVTSPWTGAFFTVDANSVYSRGPLFMLQLLVTAFYMSFVSILGIKGSKGKKTSTERSNAYSLAYFVIPPFTASVFQAFNSETPIVGIGIFMGLYFVFLNQLSIRIYNDSLTGLNNRKRAETFISDRIDQIPVKGPFYLFLIDVDFFKQINDTYGHVEGDHALQHVAQAVREAGKVYSGFAARIGGDEFIFTWEVDVTSRGPEDVVAFVQQSLNQICDEEKCPYHLSLSIGWQMASKVSDTMESLILHADQMQYSNKQATHEKAEQAEKENKQD